MDSENQAIDKKMAPKAEKAAVHFLVVERSLVQPIKAVRTRWQPVDFWHCDVSARDPWNGAATWAQVTIGHSDRIRTRRRKLESVTWNASETVLLLQLRELPKEGRSRKWGFRIHMYRHQMTCKPNKRWYVYDEIFPLPREWLETAWKLPGSSSG